MGDLVLRSLLQAAGETDLAKGLPPSKTINARVKVDREDPTEEGKLIDIVVETDSFVLGIENKIEAPINNPLDQYWEHLKRRARSTDPGQNGKAWRAVLLSLDDKNSSQAELCGFKPVTYDKLFSSLRTNLGEALSGASPKHLFYLLDFMETLENLEHRVDMMDHYMIEFFRKHEEPIKRFLKSAEQLHEELKRRTKQMRDVEPPKDIRMGWQDFPDDFGAATFFEVELQAGLHFGAQVYLDLKKWEIYTYAYYDKGCEQRQDWVERLFKTKGFPLKECRKEDWGDVWVYATYPYEETEETVRNKFQELIKQLEQRLPPGCKPA